MIRSSFIQTGLALKGRYQVQRIKADSGLIIQSSPWMNNLITHVGKDSYLSSSTNYRYLRCAVGTGNSTPNASNTALNNQLHIKAAVDHTVTPSAFTENGGTVTSTYRYRFNPGEAVGNINELGIFLDDVLFSRALVRDGNGNPTTITVLSDEYLDVYWEFTLHVAGRSTGTLSFYHKDGTEQAVDWVMKPAIAASWSHDGSAQYLRTPQVTFGGSWALLANNITGEPGYNDDTPPGMTGWYDPNSGWPLPYVNGNYYRDYVYHWALDRGNVSGINCFRLPIAIGHLWLYLPNYSFEKTNTDTLTLHFRLNIT